MGRGGVTEINRIRELRRKGGGFTLVELVVVLVIIAVLVAVVLPLLVNRADHANTTTCQSNLRIINEAVIQYKAEKGNNPNDIDTLVNDGYLRSRPKCPKAPAGTVKSYRINKNSGFAECLIDSNHTL